MIKTCLYKPLFRSLIAFLTLAGGGGLYAGEDLTITEDTYLHSDDTFQSVYIEENITFAVEGCEINVSSDISGSGSIEIDQDGELEVSGKVNALNIDCSGKISIENDLNVNDELLIDEDGVGMFKSSVYGSEIYCHGNTYVNGDLVAQLELDVYSNKSLTVLCGNITAPKIYCHGNINLTGTLCAKTELGVYKNGMIIADSVATQKIYCEGNVYVENFDISDVSNFGEYWSTGTFVVNGNIYLPTTPISSQTDLFKITLGKNACVIYPNAISVISNQIKVSKYNQVTGITDQNSKHIENSLYPTTITDLSENDFANQPGNILALPQEGFDPTITEDTIIDFDLDLSNVTDLSSFDTGTYDLIVNGDITLPESVSVKSEKFKIATFSGKVYGKRNISVEDKEIKIGDSLVTTGIMVGQDPIEKFSITSLLDIVKDETANQHGNYLTITNDLPILPVIDEEVVIDFDIYVQDGVTLTINNKINGNGTIYIEEGEIVDSKGGTLGIPLINGVGGKLVLK